VFQRLQDIESQVGQSSAADGRSPSIATLIDQLERRLIGVESRLSSSGRRNEELSGAAVAAGSSDVVDFDWAAGELNVYEKVLQVLTGETSRLQELMRKFDENQQQHKANLDSLRSAVSCSWFKPELDHFIPA